MGASTRTRRAELIGSYRDRDGRPRDVLVRQPGPDCHQVLEVIRDADPRVIEELSGEGESHATATAVARDYLEQQRRGAVW